MIIEFSHDEINVYVLVWHDIKYELVQQTVYCFRANDELRTR